MTRGRLTSRKPGPPPAFKPGDRVVYTRYFLESIGAITSVGYPVKGMGSTVHRSGTVVKAHISISDWIHVKWDDDPETEKAREAPGWNWKDAVDFDDAPSMPANPDDVIPFAPRCVSKASLALDPKVHGPNLRAVE